MKFSVVLPLISILLPAARAASIGNGPCAGLPDAGELRADLVKAPDLGGDAGGFFHGKREWGVIVNRKGQICVVVTSTPNQGDVWPGSEMIAKAKAFTANGFSLDSMPMSTTRLYTLTQPGHSLYGTPFASPFYSPAALEAPSRNNALQQPEGGAIAYGGGVALYKNGKVVGGLGVSGDTSCADHEVVKRVRSIMGLNPPGGPSADDIVFAEADGPSIFEQPLCPNTWRNGKFIGNESVAGLNYQSQNGQTTNPVNRAKVANENKTKTPAPKH